MHLTGGAELHQTLQRELLYVHGPFESIEALQAALDGWREEYNTDRPHQSLAMAFPSSRFSPAVSELELPELELLEPPEELELLAAVAQAGVALGSGLALALQALPFQANHWQELFS